MSGGFYGREQEVKSQQERSTHRGHETMETWKIEQDRVQVERPYSAQDGDVAPPEPTFLQKIARAIGGLFGRR